MGFQINQSNKDRYYNYTSLLLKMEGEDNSTSFLDDSINKVPVTAYGNAKITTSESKFGSSSASFDGTNSYLIADISSGFDFGVADFTIEFFAKFNSLSGTQFLIDFRRSGFNTTESYIQAVNTGLYYGYSSSNRISYSSGLQTGVWYHIAVTKTSGSIRMFINGMQVGSTYTDSFTHDRTTYITIGRNSRDASSYFNGYIDQLRITKGFARYIGNFTPPSLELPIESLVSSSSYDENFEKVSLLLHMDGTNSSTIFQDSSINNFSATVYGNTSLRVNQKLFGFSSAYFDGNGDYLGYGYNYDLDLIGGPFTIECWVYLPGYKPSGMRVASSGGGSVSWNGTNGIHWLFGISSTGTLNFQYWNGSSNGSFSSTSVSPVPINKWSHISFTFDGTNGYLSVDGQTQSSSISLARPTTNPSLNIGTIPGESANAAFAFWGYMEEFRITRTFARYTSNFTPIMAPFSHQLVPSTAPTSDPYFNNVSLLLHMTGTNGSTSFTDSSSNSLTVNSSGPVSISTATGKFGSSSARFSPYLNGGNSYLMIPHNDILEFGTDDFTIEMFVNFEIPRGYTFYNKGDGIKLWGDQFSSGRMFTTVNNDSGGSILSGSPSAEIGSIPQTSWHHYALCRKGNNFYVFFNGILRNTATSSSSVKVTTANLYIGSSSSTTNGYDNFTGYIDEVRITKGVARYDRKFVPSTYSFPNQ